VHSADGWDDVLKPVVARYQGKVTWRSVVKVLITALALVALIASPTFAQRQYSGEFYPASYQSPATLKGRPQGKK
jgi:hypothetical protein